MSVNEPIPINVYSKTETDLKLQLSEKSIYGRFDSVDHRMELLTQKVNLLLWLNGAAIVAVLSANLNNYFKH